MEGFALNSPHPHPQVCHFHSQICQTGLLSITKRSHDPDLVNPMFPYRCATLTMSFTFHYARYSICIWFVFEQVPSSDIKIVHLVTLTLTLWPFPQIILCTAFHKYTLFVHLDPHDACDSVLTCKFGNLCFWLLNWEWRTKFYCCLGQFK